MRIAFTGDRNFKPEYQIAIYDELAKFDRLKTEIAVGCAKGVDEIVRGTVDHLYHGMDLTVYTADWAKYGKPAGMIRNQEMIDDFKPELLIAVHDNFAESKGSKGCVEYARRKRIPVRFLRGKM